MSVLMLSAIRALHEELIDSATFAASFGLPWLGF